MSIPKKYQLVGIIVACVVVRLVTMGALRSWRPDSFGRYGFRDSEIGASLAAGQGFAWPEDSLYHTGHTAPTAWQAPIYPLVIGGTFKLLGTYSRNSAVELLLFQIAISAAVCVLLFLLGERLFQRRVGLMAALMFAFYPSALHFSAQKIEPVTLIVCLLLLLILQLLRLAREPSWQQGALAGFIAGILLLTDPTMAAFLPFAAIWFLLVARGRSMGTLSAGIVFVLAAALTISPWQIRNYLVFGHFTFIKSNFSRELYMGNYSDEHSAEEERKNMILLNEGERSRLYQNKFMKSVAGDPAQFVLHTLNRFGQFWTESPYNRATESNSERGLIELGISISYLALLLAGVIGLAVTRLKGAGVWILSMALLSLPVPYYLTWFERFRYRFPVEVILILFASCAVCRIWEHLGRFLTADKRPPTHVHANHIG